MMTQEEMRIAIAEWKGPLWKNSLSNSEQEHFERLGQIPLGANVPNYPICLNAMHEAEKRLDVTQWHKYLGILTDLMEDWRSVIHATSQQRSEALCRTL